MKKNLIIILSLLILLLTGCAGNNTAVEASTEVPTEPIAMQSCEFDRMRISLPECFTEIFREDIAVVYSNESDYDNTVMMLVLDNMSLEEFDLNKLLEDLGAESYELEWNKRTTVNGYPAEVFRYHASFEGEVSYTVNYWIQFEDKVYPITFSAMDAEFWNETYDACVESIAFS